MGRESSETEPLRGVKCDRCLPHKISTLILEIMIFVVRLSASGLTCDRRCQQSNRFPESILQIEAKATGKISSC